MLPEWSGAGSSGGLQLRFVRSGARASLPTGPEGLRKRLAILGNAHIFAAAHQAHNLTLKGLSPQTFLDHVDYILGDHVYNLKGPDTMDGPTRARVIGYEQAVREKAVVLVRKGATLANALKEARDDALTKERFFISPLALEAASAKRTAPQAPAEGRGRKKVRGAGRGGAKGEREEQRDERTSNRAGGKGGGRGSGKGRDRARARPVDPATRAPDGCLKELPNGRPVCFAYNSPKGCTRASCQFVHACGKCGGAGHKMAECTR